MPVCLSNIGGGELVGSEPLWSDIGLCMPFMLLLRFEGNVVGDSVYLPGPVRLEVDAELPFLACPDTVVLNSSMARIGTKPDEGDGEFPGIEPTGVVEYGNCSCSALVALRINTVLPIAVMVMDT